MMKTLLTALVLSVGAGTVSSSPALAQMSTASISKTEFVRMAASGDMYEIESSKLALSKSDDASVKELAQMIIKDHMESSKKLMAIAGEKPPTGMDKKHSDLLEKLKSADGKQFTQLYVSQQVQAHKEAVDLFERYSKEGEDAQLRTFATETLPRLRMHLQHAQKAQKS